jgi:hypothetical protein
VLVVEAVSNRMEHLVPLVPGILRELGHIPPKSLRKVRGAQLRWRTDAPISSAHSATVGGGAPLNANVERPLAVFSGSSARGPRPARPGRFRALAPAAY